MDPVCVWTGRSNYWIRAHHIDLHFPQLWPYFHGGSLDLQMLAGQLRADLPATSTKSIVQVLKSLFGIFQHPHVLDDEVAARVSDTLYCLFDNDIYHRIHHPKGLRSSRNHFATLASFAELTASQQLATVLIEVFWDQRRAILDYERTGKIPEWASAIESLRGLVPTFDINKCLQYLARKYNHGLDFGRGRNLRRGGGGWGLPAPRARTMPAVHYRPRVISPHPGYLPLPPPEPMYHPLPSPAHSMNYAVDPYRDVEMDELKAEQEILREKVDQLEYNQAEINMEIGMPIPGQLRLA